MSITRADALRLHRVFCNGCHACREEEPARSPYCGRIDPHSAHAWPGRDRQTGPTVIRQCPGAPLTEGGHTGINVRVREGL